MVYIKYDEIDSTFRLHKNYVLNILNQWFYYTCHKGGDNHRIISVMNGTETSIGKWK